MATSPWMHLRLADKTATNAQIAALARHSDRLEVWWVDHTTAVQGASWQASTGWQHYQLAPDYSASTGGGVTAVSRRPNVVDLFWIGLDGSVQAASRQDGGPWQLYQIAPPDSAALTGKITAVSRIPNSLEVWWIGQDGSVQDAFWYEGSGAQWQRFELAPAGSASTEGDITAVARIPNSLELWWIGPDGSVQDSFWYEGPNARWQRFELAPANSAATTGRITAVSRIPNSLEVWWIGPLGEVQDAFWYDGPNAQWQRFELAPAYSAGVESSITAIARFKDTLEVFWADTQDTLQYATWQDGKSWKRVDLDAGEKENTSSHASIACTSRLPTTLEIYRVGTDLSLLFESMRVEVTTPIDIPTI